MNIEKDIFNSDIFGINMGNIIEYKPEDGNKEIRATIQMAHRDGYDHLAVKISADNNRLTNCFLRKGFYIADSQVTYEIDISLAKNRIEKELKKNNKAFAFHEIKNANEKYQITSISKNAFTTDRFHSDYFLSKERADQYYMKWSKNCCEGLNDKVYVMTSDDGAVIGYITLSFQDKDAIVGLAAIAPEFRGRGLFSELIRSTIIELKSIDKERLFYGTQISNLPVLSAMNRVHAKVCRCNHVLHYIMNTKDSMDFYMEKDIHEGSDSIEVLASDKRVISRLISAGFYLEETGIYFSADSTRTVDLYKQILSGGLNSVEHISNADKAIGSYYLLKTTCKVE